MAPIGKPKEMLTDASEILASKNVATQHRESPTRSDVEVALEKLNNVRREGKCPARRKFNTTKDSLSSVVPKTNSVKLEEFRHLHVRKEKKHGSTSSLASSDT